MGKLFGVYELKQALPQWQNRLMLDRAEIIDETHAVAVKNLTNNEEFFNGHFPNHPIMPGVLQVEAMRQLAELLGKEKLAPADGEYIYIKSMGKTRFRRPNVPGDRIKIEVELIEEAERELTFKTNISNSAGAACDSQFTLAVRSIPGPKAMPELFNASDKNAELKLNEEQLIDMGMLQIEALTYIRGRSIPNQYIIIDEAQNLTPHEVKTIITRVGQGTKIVLTGDPYQIDNPYVDADSNGLSYVINKFKGVDIAATVTLTKGERSKLAELASNLL